MSEEWTVGDLFEEIAERVATARTRALMGEREEALALLQRAHMDYLRFGDILKGYPGSLALEHSLEVARAALCAERLRDREHSEPETGERQPGDSSIAA
jgi:hypothetical protein